MAYTHRPPSSCTSKPGAGKSSRDSKNIYFAWQLVMVWKLSGYNKSATGGVADKGPCHFHFPMEGSCLHVASRGQPLPTLACSIRAGKLPTPNWLVARAFTVSGFCLPLLSLPCCCSLSLVSATATARLEQEKSTRPTLLTTSISTSTTSTPLFEPLRWAVCRQSTRPDRHHHPPDRSFGYSLCEHTGRPACIFSDGKFVLFAGVFCSYLCARHRKCCVISSVAVAVAGPVWKLPRHGSPTPALPP